MIVKIIDSFPQTALYGCCLFLQSDLIRAYQKTQKPKKKSKFIPTVVFTLLEMSVRLIGKDQKISIRSLLSDQTVYCRVTNVFEAVGFRTEKERTLKLTIGKMGVKPGQTEHFDVAEINLASLNNTWYELRRVEGKEYYEKTFNTIGIHCGVSVFVEATSEFCSHIFSMLSPNEFFKTMNNLVDLKISGKIRRGILVIENEEYKAEEIIPKGIRGVEREFMHNSCIVYQPAKNSMIQADKGYGNRRFRKVSNRFGCQNYFAHYGMKCHCGELICKTPLDYKGVVGYCGEIDRSELKKKDNLFARLGKLGEDPFKAKYGIFAKGKAEIFGMEKNDKVLNPTVFGMITSNGQDKLAITDATEAIVWKPEIGPKPAPRNAKRRSLPTCENAMIQDVVSLDTLTEKLEEIE